MRHLVTPQNWYRQDFSACRVRDIQKNPLYQQRLSRLEKERIKRIFLSVFTVAAALGLGLWLYNLTKGAKPPG
jgi:hypothetical protein